MNRLQNLFRLSAFQLFVAAASVAQTGAPAPAAAQTPAQPTPYTLSVTSKLVVIDVTVTDKHGKPIHGLKASDFTLKENSEPQQVKSFEEHAALASTTALPTLPKLPPGDFSNIVVTPPSAAVDVLLIDRLNTRLPDQVYLLQQLREYAKNAAPDARVAVFILTDHLILAKGFTQDVSVLQKALEMAANPKTSPLGDGGLGQASENLSANTGFLSAAGLDILATGLANADKSYQSYQNELRSELTLEAFNTIGRSLITIPGRKNLIWFAGHFPPGIFPGDTDVAGYSLDAKYRETINLLSQCRVSVYPIEATGLQTSHVMDATVAMRGTAKTSSAPNDLANEGEAIAAAHIAMEKIAYDTGGKAFYNSNDLVKGTREAISGGSDFYTLAYAPSDSSTKHDYRNISVKLAQPGTSLGYRRGYYFDSSDKEKKDKAVAEAAGASPATATGLRQALFLGGPEPTEVLLRVHAAPTDTKTEDTVAKGNQVNPDPKKTVAGPFRSYGIQIAASARNMSFSHGSDNIYHTSIDFVTNVYNSKGVLVNAQSNTLKTNYDAKGFLEVMRGGILFNQLISVPVKGDYYLRVAVQDKTSGHVGAVELPVAAVAQLPPPPPAAAEVKSSALKSIGDGPSK